MDAPRVSSDTCSGTGHNLNALAVDFDPSSCLLSTLPSPHRTTGESEASTASDTRFGSEKRSSICSSHANSTSQTPIQGTGTNGLATTAAFDPFVTAPAPIPAAGVGNVPGNPYSHDTAAVAATAAALNGAAFFANQSGFQQPVSCYPICFSKVI